jgi:hypothetical protein
MTTFRIDPRLVSSGQPGAPVAPETAPDVFVSREIWNPQRIGALALYCSDGRWGEAFDQFCHEALNLPRYDRFAVPGGPACLAMRHVNQLTPYSAARDQIALLVRVHKLERIVLIAHYGCAVYADMTGLDADAAVQAQEEDLRTAANTLRGWFAGMQVDGYFALRQDTAFAFRRVDV